MFRYTCGIRPTDRMFKDHQRIGTLALHGREGADQIGVGAGDVDDLWPHPNLLQGAALRLRKAIGNAAVRKQRDPRKVRFHRPQQCDVRPRLIGIVGRNSGHVAAGLPRWSGETVPGRIDDNRINNRNVLCGFSRRAGRHRPDRRN